MLAVKQYDRPEFIRARMSFFSESEDRKRRSALASGGSTQECKIAMAKKAIPTVVFTIALFAALKPLNVLRLHLVWLVSSLARERLRTVVGLPMSTTVVANCMYIWQNFDALIPNVAVRAGAALMLAFVSDALFLMIWDVHLNETLCILAKGKRIDDLPPCRSDSWFEARRCWSCLSLKKDPLCCSTCKKAWYCNKTCLALDARAAHKHECKRWINDADFEDNDNIPAESAAAVPKAPDNNPSEPKLRKNETDASGKKTNPKKAKKIN